METFLLRLCTYNWEQTLPADKPRRGQPLPRTQTALADALHNRHCAASTAYASEISKIIGILHDLVMKLRRWTTRQDAAQGETDLELPVTINTVLGTQSGGCAH